MQWRGAANVDGYRVERARSERGPWRAAHSGLRTDNDTPWTDPAASGDVWYRVVPFHGGRTGRTSQPVYAGSRETVLVDPLETLGIAGGSAGLQLQPGADGTIARPAGNGDAWVSWRQPGTRRAEFEVVAPRRPELTVQTSADGKSWRTVRSSTDRNGNDRYTVTASTASAGHVRLVWPGGPATRSRTALQQATLWAADPAPVTGAPAAFTPVIPAAGAAGVIGPESFSWAPAVGAGYYRLTVSRHADLSDPVIDVTGLAAPAYEPAQGLAPATTWYWRVWAVNVAGSTSTPVTTFTTRAVPSTPVTLDDYEGYAGDVELTRAYVPNTGGDPVTSTLVASPSGTGRAMALDVTAGPSGYAGVSRSFSAPVDLWGQEGLELRLDRSGTRAEISIQFVADGVYWEHTLPAGTASGVVRLPFTAFEQPSWAPSGPLDLRKFLQLSIYLGGADDTGRLIVDDVRAYPPGGLVR